MTKYWPTGLGLIAGLAAIGAGLLAGSDPTEGWQFAARWTARASFPFFIAAFAASALVRLHPSTLTKALLRDRRWWGLGFAACFTLHAVSLLVFNRLDGNFPPTGPGDPGFYLYLVLLAMVLTSTDPTRKRLGSWWKLLHRVGMWGFWTVFVVSPYLGAVHDMTWPEGNPLTDPYFLVGASAALLKLAAYRKGRAKRRARLA